MKSQEESVQIFDQLIDVINQLSNEEYSMPLKILSNNSIGKHIRHIIEFYDLALAAYSAEFLNYDLRKRNLDLECDKYSAIDKLCEMKLQLQKCFEDRALLLGVAYSEGIDQEVSLKTSFFRELHYNIEHAIHHMAVIRISLGVELPHILPASHFGIAYSTVNNRRKNKSIRHVFFKILQFLSII